MKLDKPPVGAPCNGCGLCCETLICSAGSFTMGLVTEYGRRAPGPCPALVTEPDGRKVCGMVKRPKDYAPGKRGGAHDLRAAIMLLIGAGAGCDELGDSDDPAENSKLDELLQDYADKNSHKIDGAVRRWYLGED